MKKLLSKMDLWLLTLTICYAVLGCIMIYSASSILTVLKQGVPANYYFIRQAIILVISFTVGLIVLRIPTSKYRLFTPFLIIGITASLAGLYIYGHIANGTQGWYDLGFFNMQPAEFAKSVIIIYMAVYYHKLIKKQEKNFLKYLVPVVVGGVNAVLVLMQPDLGSAVIIGGIVILIFFSLPLSKPIKAQSLKVFGIGVIIGLMTILVAGDAIFNEYQINRLKFQNPCSRYTESTGYQVCNGFIAIKNGGLFGLGFGKSTQKYLYLPEAHTDFIYPIICEELGLFAGILIILLYAFMLYRILLIAKRANNIRNSILAYGTFIYLLLHILVNLLGVLALIPLTGVPLPLLSYGGSFNINVIIMLSICQRVSIETKNSRLKQQIAEI